MRSNRRGAASTGVVGRLAALAGAVLLMAGCSGADLDSRKEVGSLVVGWSEYDEDVGGVDRTRPWLIEDEADLADLLAALPRSLDTSPLTEVALSDHVLVVGAWAQCKEHSRVVLAADRTTITFQVVEEQPETHCGWSPVQVDAWQVPRADLGAGDVTVRYGRGQAGSGGRVTCPEREFC